MDMHYGPQSRIIYDVSCRRTLCFYLLSMVVLCRELFKSLGYSDVFKSFMGAVGGIVKYYVLVI